MMTYSKYIDDAFHLGFSHAVVLEDLELQCDDALRAYCNPQQCPNYGTTWVCPPGCGSIEDCQMRVAGYKTGIVLQTVSKVPVYFGKWRTLHWLEREHNTRLLQLADRVRRDGYSTLPLTTGGCIVCDPCTFPKRACREPGRRMHSLSAYGINVGELCKKAGLDFAFEKGIVYYTACLMVR